MRFAAVIRLRPEHEAAYRQLHDETRAGSQGRVDEDHAGVPLDDVARDREPETHPTGLARAC